MTPNNSPQWLMCQPEHYGVEYVINPWMENNIGQARRDIAMQQWESLHEILAQHGTVHLLPSFPKLPDLCFTANAGLVFGNTFIPARFKFKERQPEESHFINWFKKHNYQIVTLDNQVHFEGEGDALFQPGEQLLWVGYGIRTDYASHALLNNLLNIEVASLHLVSPHYYHLDTCFVPLPGKKAIYYPAAFDMPSLEKLRAYFPLDKRHEVSDEDAAYFACNAIILNDRFICNNASTTLQNKLKYWGFEVITTPLTEFLLAGGAAKCLVLNL